MLASERQSKILELVNERGSIEVSELVQIFEVTGETIRRDLDKLEYAGKLQRNHGGAVRITGNEPEIPYFIRETTNIAEKMEITKEVLKYIKPEDQIILDASSTAWFVSTVLPNMPLTVLTNSIRVSMELAKKNKIQVICTGGILFPSSMCFVGPSAVRSLDGYHVSKAFISSKGLDIQRGASEPNELAVIVKHKMIEISDEVFFLMDYSKFGVKDFVQVASLDQIDYIITDRRTDPSLVKDYESFSIKVIQAKSSES